MADESHSRLSRDEVRELTERLAEVAATGLPLADGLRAAASEIPGRRIRHSLQQLAGFVQQGGTLDQAVHTGRLSMPRHLAGLLHAGARSGRLVEVLTELADHYRRSRDLWRELWLALSYPVILLTLLGVIVAVIVAFVIPEMETTYGLFSTELPATTRSVFWFSRTGWKYLAVALMVLAAAAITIRLLGGARAWTRVLSSIPGFGRLIQWQGFAEFARLLQLLLRQDTPLPQALRLTADGVRNASVAHAARQLATLTEQGQSLSTGMQTLPEVPGPVIPLVRSGEQQGELPAALAVVCELLEGQIVLRSRLLMVVLPPIAFLIVAAVACALVISLLSPLVGGIANLTY